MNRTRTIAPLLLLVVLIASCQRNNIIPQPRNPETVALALYGGFVIAEEAAVAIAENPATPAGVRAALIDADERATPVMAQLRPAAEAVQAAREALANGSGTQEQLVIAIRNLNGWVEQAAPLIKALTDLVTGVSR